MRDILDGICAKALRNSLVKQIPTKLLFLILSFVLDNCASTWFHLRLVSCQFFSLLDQSFVKLFGQTLLEASEVSLSAWLELARSTCLRSYVHGIDLSINNDSRIGDEEVGRSTTYD